MFHNLLALFTFRGKSFKERSHTRELIKVFSQHCGEYFTQIKDWTHYNDHAVGERTFYAG